MKRYEGLFILDLANKEEGLPDAIEKVKSTIASAGGRVDTVTKLDRRPFARVTNRKIPAGHYLNIHFSAPANAVAPLREKFSLVPEVYRVIFTLAGPVTPAAKVA